MGDFYDFKLYIIINDEAEILSYTITQTERQRAFKKRKILEKYIQETFRKQKVYF